MVSENGHGPEGRQPEDNGRDHAGRFLPGNTHGFPPGVSGNPSGGRKGTMRLDALLREIIVEEIEVKGKGRREVRDVILRVLAKKAMQGDLRAIEMVFDRIDGKPKETGEFDISVGAPRMMTLDDVNAALARVAGTNGKHP